MRNLTFKERAIVVGVILTMLIGAGHRYYQAKAAAGERTLVISDSGNAKS